MLHSDRTEPTTSNRDQPGGRTAPLIIDMINCLDLDGLQSLAPNLPPRFAGSLAWSRIGGEPAPPVLA